MGGKASQIVLTMYVHTFKVAALPLLPSAQQLPLASYGELTSEPEFSNWLLLHLASDSITFSSVIRFLFCCCCCCCCCCFFVLLLLLLFFLGGGGGGRRGQGMVVSLSPLHWLDELMECFR